MSTPRAQRKLATILAADVVGYSKMMGEHEEVTLRVLRTCREIIDATIEEYGGRIFNTAGDAVLAEFTSPVEAVRCAVDFQRALHDRNEQVPQHMKMIFRVGINLGDVIIEGDNILGDGVNIAARLESICEPGGVCVSGSVYEHIKNKIALEFGDLGEQVLKNIVEPVPAFQVRMDSEGAASVGKPKAGAAKAGDEETAVVIERPVRKAGGLFRLVGAFVVLLIAMGLLLQAPALLLPANGRWDWLGAGIAVIREPQFVIGIGRKVGGNIERGMWTYSRGIRVGLVQYVRLKQVPMKMGDQQEPDWYFEIFPSFGAGLSATETGTAGAASSN